MNNFEGSGHRQKVLVTIQEINWNKNTAYVRCICQILLSPISD